MKHINAGVNVDNFKNDAVGLVRLRTWGDTLGWGVCVRCERLGTIVLETLLIADTIDNVIHTDKTYFSSTPSTGRNQSGIPTTAPPIKPIPIYI